MKKVISLIGLSMLMMLMIVPMSFADSLQAPISQKVMGDARVHRDLDVQQVHMEKLNERNIKLYTNYDSEDLTSYNNVYAEQLIVRNELESLAQNRDIEKEVQVQNRDELKATRVQQMKDLKAKLKSGEMTREEAIALLTNRVKESKETTPLKEELAKLQELKKANLTSREEIRAVLLEGLYTNNDIQVKTSLNQLLKLQQEQLQYDKSKLELIKASI